MTENKNQLNELTDQQLDKVEGGKHLPIILDGGRDDAFGDSLRNADASVEELLQGGSTELTEG